MKLSFIMAGIIAAGIAITPTTVKANPAQPLPQSPLSLYGETMSFDVYRNGSAVGQHAVRFVETPGGIKVISKMTLAINFLMFEAYRYEYNSVADWRGGQLFSLEARTDDDGGISTVSVKRIPGQNQLSVTGPEGSATAPQGLFPTNHWNAGVLGSRQVINTLTGRINQVQIIDKGEARIDTASGPITARHYAYQGDLETEVWYDKAGRWVKMRFAGKDGSTIEYKCQKCGLQTASNRGP